jgi:hypothetical protein
LVLRIARLANSSEPREEFACAISIRTERDLRLE